jgi:ATP-binding cassette, subfamily B, bacterial
MLGLHADTSLRRFESLAAEDPASHNKPQAPHSEFDDIAADLSSDNRPASPGPYRVSHVPHKAIRFEDVRFRYATGEPLILDGLDLELEAGRSTAIVGLNGAGKTTLVKLLTRLYDPDSGRITVDGADLRDIDPRAWHHRIAVIFQDFVRYELPAAANITLGAAHVPPDPAALARAVDRAGAREIIDALPAGERTVLSRRYQGGRDLSGGEWQRIALARALYAVEAGAKILVMDEPTAHLDVRAEVAFYDNFLTLTEGLTTVVISHRFSSVRRADRIVVLEDGRVAEQGAHDALIAASGRYAELFHLQAKRFTELEPPHTPAASSEGAR